MEEYQCKGCGVVLSGENMQDHITRSDIEHFVAETDKLRTYNDWVRIIENNDVGVVAEMIVEEG